MLKKPEKIKVKIPYPNTTQRGFEKNSEQNFEKFKVIIISWKKQLRKAELPPKPEAGTQATNEYRQAQDSWANEYVNKIVQYLNGIGDTMNSSWCKIDPQAKTVSWDLTSGSKTFSFEQFANELKSLLRAVVYGQFKKYNYAYTPEIYLKDSDLYVRDIMRNSTASNAFTNWLQK